jgi:hypothetical protein
MKQLKKLVLFVIFMIGSLTVFCDPPQPPNPGGTTGGVPVGSPIDNETWILLSMVVVFASYKIIRVTKQQNRLKKSKMSKITMISILLLGLNYMTFSQNVNSWNNNNGGDWQVVSNWSLGHQPTSTEKVLIHTGNSNIIITNVPTTSISQLEVINQANKTVVLQPSVIGNTITILGGCGIDLDLTDDDANLNLNNINLIMSTGTYGQLEKSFACKTITFEPRSTFSIIGNGHPSFTVDSLILKSDFFGSSSFLVEKNSPDLYFTSLHTQVQLYLTCNKWHYVSSPVDNAMSGVFYWDFLRNYIEPTNSWSDWIVPTNVPLINTFGYEVWDTNTTQTRIHTFNGNLHNGDYTVNLTRTYIPSMSDYNGWNLIGNPYPSSVDWDSPQSHLTLNNIDPTIYYWCNGVYLSYNRFIHLGTGSRYIPPMQGVFVHVHNYTSGSVTFKNESRTHNVIPLYKDDYIFKDLLSLSIDSIEKTYIYFVDSSTVDFDWKFDNYKMVVEGSTQIYSELSDSNTVSVNTLPYTNNNVVNVGFKCEKAGDYTITAGDIDTFDPNVPIFLEDKITNQTQNLRTNPVYTFYHDPQFSSSRFLVHFYNLNFVQEEQEKNDIIIYSNKKDVYVKSSDNGIIKIYDLLGREVFNNIVNKNFNKYITTLNNGYYIVTVQSEKNIINKKVYLN